MEIHIWDYSTAVVKIRRLIETTYDYTMRDFSLIIYWDVSSRYGEGIPYFVFVDRDYNTTEVYIYRDEQKTSRIAHFVSYNSLDFSDGIVYHIVNELNRFKGR